MYQHISLLIDWFSQSLLGDFAMTLFFVATGGKSNISEGVIRHQKVRFGLHLHIFYDQSE